ncbi:hypothetical protein QJU03_09780 [Pasteurella atlantica]|uniref:hypothetical protein n=1 Tax=Pasteurella atlantica TaxID=2827233 RepID=UPI0027791A60|nr:hypothetical protein [Pasteurella atlantica]MDP8048797.1 hypothetical protein [Pasteurella atlantica]MDP8151447.1 hypothetical protein [Pasteurella atlantica]
MCYTLFSAVSTVTELDKDGDGIADTTTEVITKPDGTVITTVHTDSNDDGKQDSVVNIIEKSNGVTTTETGTITHKDNGTQVINYNIDHYSDGKDMHVRIDKLDAEGNITEEKHDLNLDGKMETIVERSFDDNGLIQEERTYIGGLSQPSNIKIFDIANGTATLTKIRAGRIFETQEIEYANASDQTKEAKTIFKDSEGNIKSTETYKYNDKGQLEEKSVEKNGSLKNEYYEHDNETGNTTKVSYDNDGDPSTPIDSFVVNEYDQYGTLIKRYYDKDGDPDTPFDRFVRFDNMNDQHLYEKLYYNNGQAFNDLKFNDIKQQIWQGFNRDGDLSNGYEQIDYYSFTEERDQALIIRDTNGHGRFISYLYYDADLQALYDDNPSEGKDVFSGLTNMTILNVHQQEPVILTLSDEMIDKMVGNTDNHKFYVDSYRENKLVLQGSFEKTGETEIRQNQSYELYSDEAGHVVVVDPDLIVDII